MTEIQYLTRLHVGPVVRRTDHFQPVVDMIQLLYRLNVADARDVCDEHRNRTYTHTEMCGEGWS